MKTNLLIYEPRYTGHHPMYVRHASKDIIPLFDKVTAVVNDAAMSDESFIYHVVDRTEIGTFDRTAPRLPWQSSRARCNAFFSGLVAAIEQHSPDWVIVPTADDLAVRASLNPMDTAKRLSSVCPIQCGFHYSFFRRGLPITRMAASIWKTICLRLLPIYSICLDPYAAEQCSLLFKGDKLSTCPIGPVDNDVAEMDKQTARRILSLPLGRKIVGSLGALSTNPNKGVLELLNTLKQGDENFAVLLGGRLSKDMREIIKNDFTKFIESGRLLLIDKYLSDRELLLALKSIDLSWNVYRNFYATSSIAFYSVALGTPVAVPDSGWFRDLLNDFPLGCTVGKKSVTGSEVAEILNGLENSELAPAIQDKLINFSSAANFSASWASQYMRVSQLGTGDVIKYSSIKS